MSRLPFRAGTPSSSRDPRVEDAAAPSFGFAYVTSSWPAAVVSAAYAARPSLKTRANSLRRSSSVAVCTVLNESVRSCPWNRARPMNFSVQAMPPPPVSCVVTSTCTSATARSRTYSTKVTFCRMVLVVAAVAIEEHLHQAGRRLSRRRGGRRLLRRGGRRGGRLCESGHTEAESQSQRGREAERLDECREHQGGPTGPFRRFGRSPGFGSGRLGPGEWAGAAGRLGHNPWSLVRRGAAQGGAVGADSGDVCSGRSGSSRLH